ncbi:23S rRNA (guanine(745)-N(1))-methyltransferase [Vibrio hippocampi]|uniref:23S rRNA (Guanine(745)-N(1))-methyltransferase n=1 Tax=Vibrio hippocampi TaxID=654686 RepID=A0ABN8DGV8_9VIBR|nr:23S rRNA (guanine(745)-N(1))-methyltransferase [Vibrio hippocampi]CAH0526550.1 23S rRNA (guanine(745)-N(1))-methyltransferase [Vibrio hippocampi]
MPYQCPLCELPLTRSDRSFVCNNNHQFDCAKEGYVNLMPVQHKGSKNPGDNKEMMQARRTFLAHGFYAPMRDKVAQTLTHYLTPKQHTVLDIGCGEGYYTSYFQQHAEQQGHQSDYYGLDISKVAIRYAAKRYPNIEFSVASSHRLPFADNSLDAIIRIYAPCKHEELQRCLNAQSIMITVTPASHHLYELRELIYQDVRLHSEEAEQIDGFELIDDLKLSYPMDLTGQQADDLLQMTPFAWKASLELRASLKQQSLFICQADFTIRIYRKS